MDVRGHVQVPLPSKERLPGTHKTGAGDARCGGIRTLVLQPLASQFTHCFIRTLETSYTNNGFTSCMGHVTWNEKLEDKRKRTTKILKSVASEIRKNFRWLKNY
jgi:hypothetical protein